MYNFEITNAILLILIVKIAYAEVLNSTQVTVYTDVTWTGYQQDVDSLLCTNLSTNIAKRVKSVKTKNNCFRLYEEEDCKGKFIELLPNSPFQRSLFEWNFANLAASAGPCGGSCDATLKGPLPSESGINVTVYQFPYYRGKMVKIYNLNRCTKLPRKMSQSIKSINFMSNKNGCIELYNNPECRTDGEKVGGVRRKSVQLRSSTPSLDDLNCWKKHIQIVGAISHCSYNCNASKESDVLTSTEMPTKDNPVILYDETNFTGNALSIRLSGCNQCIPLDQFDNWEGEVKSAKVYEAEDTCVVLYDELDCTGRWELTLLRSEAEIGTRKYCKRLSPADIRICRVVRSLQFCDLKKTE